MPFVSLFVTSCVCNCNFFFWYGCVVFSFFWGTMLMSSLRLYPSQYRTFVTIISCVCEFVKWGPLSLTTFTRSHASHSVAHAQLSPMDSKAHQLLTINSQQEFQVLVHLQPFSLSLSLGISDRGPPPFEGFIVMLCRLKPS